jgi:hypothetical protein
MSNERVLIANFRRWGRSGLPIVTLKYPDASITFKNGDSSGTQMGLRPGLLVWKSPIWFFICQLIVYLTMLVK